MAASPAGAGFLSVLRHQLPARSPLSLSTLAAASLARSPADALDELGQRLMAQMGAEKAILLESGTQALTLAFSLAAPGPHRKPRVALPAFGCFDLASAAVGADADVVAYDLDPSTLSPDPGSLEKVLRSGVDAVVVAHLYGIPIEWEGVAALVASAGTILIEDAAQGHGASLDGRRLGSLGDLSVLSFGRGKGWTGGGGGALLARNGIALPSLPPRVGRRPLLGAWIQWALGRPSLFGLPHLLPWLQLGETVYQPPRPPAAMGRRPAALVLSTQALAEVEAEKRRSTGEWYRRALRHDGGRLLLPSPPRKAVPGFLRFPVMAHEGSAGILSRAGARRAGLAPTYPKLIPELPALRDRLRGGGSWPGAEELVRGLLTLPTHGLVSESDREEIVSLLREGLGLGAANGLDPADLPNPDAPRRPDTGSPSLNPGTHVATPDPPPTGNLHP
jgi:perosamine synthetase